MSTVNLSPLGGVGYGSGATPTEQSPSNTVGIQETGGSDTCIRVVVAAMGSVPQRMAPVGRGRDDGDSNNSDSDLEDEVDHLMVNQGRNPPRGDLLWETCKRSSKICGCLLLLATAICIVVVVAGVTPMLLLLQDNSATLYVNTTFNSTVVFQLEKFVKNFTITSERDDDYACVLATVTLPCSSLSKSFLRNQSVNDVSNDLERLYFYLLSGSVMHFVFYSDSLCSSYTLWVFSDKLNDQITSDSSVACNSLSEQKFNGKCKTFTGSGVYDFQVPKDAYYFYTGYDCKRAKLLLTIDYYWYNFSQYVNRSDVQTVYIPPGKHRVITAANSYSFSRICTLIHTPNTSDCRAVNSFESPVLISEISFDPMARLIFILPVVCVTFIVISLSLFVCAFCFVRKFNKVKSSYACPLQPQN